MIRRFPHQFRPFGRVHRQGKQGRCATHCLAVFHRGNPQLQGLRHALAVTKANQRARHLIELADAEAQLAEAISEAEHSEAAIKSLVNAMPVSEPQAALAAPPAEKTPSTVVYTNNIDE